jgi:hypothetical protein
MTTKTTMTTTMMMMMMALRWMQLEMRYETILFLSR